jgi:uncharacterized phage protein (TIGR01671 family)
MKIDFKAWLKSEEKIAQVLTMNIAGDKLHEIMTDQGNKRWYSADEVNIMQFAGLYDDSGSKIYDGYFVEVRNASETQTSHISRVYMTYDGVRVEPHPTHKAIGLGKPRLLSSYCDYGFGGKYNVSCKIVGNIYENPELLEKWHG